MEDGIIELGTERGDELGFTFDKFTEVSYLWKNEDYITISFIESKHEGKGNLSKLFNVIFSKGYGIKVPTPLARMEAILKHYGFKQTEEEINGDVCEVWVREPKKHYGVGIDIAKGKSVTVKTEYVKIGDTVTITKIQEEVNNGKQT